MGLEDLIYIAGFFDGEGCVVISHSKRRGKWYHRLRVQVSQKEKEILKFIQRKFGGYLYNNNANGHYLWHWGIGDIKAYNFLKQIYPYLKGKRKVVKFGLIFQILKTYRKNKGCRWSILIPEETEVREKIRQKIQRLNRGGN